MSAERGTFYSIAKEAGVHSGRINVGLVNGASPLVGMDDGIIDHLVRYLASGVATEQIEGLSIGTTNELLREVASGVKNLEIDGVGLRAVLQAPTEIAKGWVLATETEFHLGQTFLRGVVVDNPGDNPRESWVILAGGNH